MKKPCGVKHVPTPRMSLCLLIAAFALIVMAFQLSGCSSMVSRHKSRDCAPPFPVDMSKVKPCVPKVEPKSRCGNPASYVVFGKRYYVQDTNQGYCERGIASWYGMAFHKRRTSSGERFSTLEMTAAHKTLPLPTYARVTNLENGRSVVVKINDRGPFHDDRIIDLSYVAAVKLGVYPKGTAAVEVKAIDPAVGGRRRAVHHPAVHQRSPSHFVEADTAAPLAPPAPPRAMAQYVQIGSFTNQQRAFSSARKANQLIHIHPQVIKESTSTGSRYLVQVGPIDDPIQRKQLMKKLQSNGWSSPLVVKE